MKYLVIIPTYNEKGNITRIIKEILEQEKNLSLLIVDDNSPDKTAQIVKKIARGNPRINLLERKGKQGLGTAYRDGFSWGLKKGFDHFISMDADFSHPPQALPKMIALAEKNPQSIILGSRYIPGGKIVGWDYKRYLNSSLANKITRFILGIKAKDATAGFKCYPKEFLHSINLKSLVASGYAFQVEMLFLAREHHFNVIEFPIVFRDRRVGQSKISGELAKSARIVFRLAIRRQVFRQFIKFGIVGLINTGVDWGIFFGIKILTGWNTQGLKQLIKAISFTVSASSSYTMNRFWTFRSQDKAILKQATKFFSVALVGLGLNNLIFYIITGILHWRDIFGLAIATAIVLIWNFSANKLWVFKERNL